MSGNLLDQTGRFVRRFVVVSDVQRDGLALFVAHTHALEASDATPYIHIYSPLKRCGKTRALEVLELLVREPLPAVNASTSALFRTIEDRQPTLLLDEVDAIFSPKAGDKEELRGILNAGYRRGAFVYRMGGSRMTTLEAFPVFCAKVLAGIGDLPDTIQDRAVRVRLERRTRGERVERFRRREVEPEADELRVRLADWLEPQIDHIRSLRPELPDELDDRAQDIWEPLLAIADLAGGDWPQRARVAALALSTGEAREDDSLGLQLLRDIHDVFAAHRAERYPTGHLIAELAKIEESPWGDWHGKTISPQALGRLLKPHRIKTMPVWVGGETHRGYKREQFEDAWLRLLGVRGVRSVRSESPSHAAPNTHNAPNTLYAERAEGRIALPGDPGFPLRADIAVQNGHLTESELAERLGLHALVRTHEEQSP